MTAKQNVAETVARLRCRTKCVGFKAAPSEDGSYTVCTAQYGPDPEMQAAADLIEALSAQLAGEQAAVEQLRYIAGVNIQRAEAAEAERDELDFILHEGGDDSVAKLIAERDRLREELDALIAADEAAR
jgi:hypothetical protein